MKKISFLLTTVFMLGFITLSAQPSDSDPVGKEPGKCYAKCLIGDEYETVTEQIETKAASKRVEVVPAQYETVSEQMEKTAASSRLIAVPAKFSTETERVLIKEESKRLIYVPAEYETVSELSLIHI